MPYGEEKILIVDDSVDTRLVVSARLKKHGYDTAFATDALQAMSVAKERPDAILLDFAILSGVNGRNCHECGERSL
ncbi:MAG: hypothetical protein H7Y39_12290 [Nitrospiraceae bacterium]|nr:hypothetical protein [Nitrospiraceae bacterium]